MDKYTFPQTDMIDTVSVLGSLGTSDSVLSTLISSVQ